MRFAQRDDLLKLSKVFSLKPATAPHNGLSKGRTAGLKLYNEPGTTGKGLAAASERSIAAAQASSPEAAVEWTFAGAYIRQGKQAS